MPAGPDSLAATGFTHVRQARTRGPVAPVRERTSADLAAVDDQALVEAFQSGRREAFDLIVERHQRRVYDLCFRFSGNHADAADLVQDVFIRAFRGLPRFRRTAALGTWLYRIAVNACLSRPASARQATEPLEAARQVDTSLEDPLDAVVRAERARTMRAAVDALPPKQRAAVVLRVYHELSHEEIARVLESTVGAVKTNFFHALQNLKRRLQHP